jgi:hypothetical protein
LARTKMQNGEAMQRSTLAVNEVTLDCWNRIRKIETKKIVKRIAATRCERASQPHSFSASTCNTHRALL